MTGRALRSVFVAALAPAEVAASLGWSRDDADGERPASLYDSLADQARSSPTVWRRAARRVDESLAEYLLGHWHTAPVALAHAFERGRDRLPMLELVAIVWSLLRRRDAALDPLIARLGDDLDLLAVRRAVDAGVGAAMVAPASLAISAC